jgi:CNP1-like family
LRPSDWFRVFFGGVCAVAAVCAHAQFSDLDPDWKENQVPTPPAFSSDRLIDIDVAKFSNLRFGIDPNTISLTPDGVVRYVVVASSSTGVRNAMYEGIRCVTGEVKVYARHTGQDWNLTTDPKWRALQDPQQPSRHSLSVARNGLCLGASPNGSVQQMVRDLRAPVDTRFGAK